MDATGLTAEEVLGKILDASGVPDPWPLRVDWLGQLERAGVNGRPLLVANFQPTGRTRRSMQPSRVLKQVLDPLVRNVGPQGDRRIGPGGGPCAAELVEPPASGNTQRAAWP